MSEKSMESTVDVLIIGAGPAGYMLSAWLSRLRIPTRIIDKRGTKIFNGQADGLQCRTLEIFDSFGFADRAWKESNHMVEFCMWNPDSEGKLRRSDRVPNTPQGISRYQEVVLTQGRIERFFLDHMKENGGLEVERGVLPEELTFERERAEDEGEEAYPVTVRLRHLSDEEATPAQNNTSVPDGLFRSSLAKDDTDDLIRRSQHKGGETEVVRAKYVVGCDGAHSWTRRQLGAGFELEGEATDLIWGVLDIIPITDFPDIRSRCAIHSASSGSMMVIPREKGLVRLYIQLTEVKPDESGRADRSQISPDSILKAAQKILHPYKLEYNYCDWWTGYQIGQRVGNKFSDQERIFLAGDAIHTHSPKAGQGMNVSMQDTFNLGWKLGLVLKGVCDRSILRTYQDERRGIAKDLIAFDHKFSRLFSGRPAKDAADETGVNMAEFKAVYMKGHEFASGISVNYGGSPLVAKATDTPSSTSSYRTSVTSKQHLATTILLGKRFPSHQVLNQSDARPWPLQHFLAATGAFYIVIFAGAVASSPQLARLEACCKELKKLLARFPEGAIELLTVHSSPRASLERGIFDLPALLRQRQPGGDQGAGKLGWDYNRIFADEASYHSGDGKAYEGYGVDKERGCLVVCRPDQYVSYIGELEDVSEVETFFSGFMRRRGQETRPLRGTGGDGDASGGDKAKVEGAEESEGFKQANREAGSEELTGLEMDQAAGLAE